MSAGVKHDGPLSRSGLIPATELKPFSNFVNPMLTDMYQITMTYAYWKAGRHLEYAVFDMFFRKSPFEGEFTIFAGLDEAIKLVQTFRFTPEHVDYLKSLLPMCEPEFWVYLAALDCSEMKLYAIAEGTVVFPRVPLVRVEGPLAVGQLLETTLLNLCNFASLICTNACRHRLAAGKDKTLLEFGLRRAQGPDGAMSATRYSYVGGFDGTSNVLGGMCFGMKPMGTHAHSFVSAYVGLEDLKTRNIDGVDIVDLALKYRSELGYNISSVGELAAFVAYAQAFPDAFLALVDTYDTLSSGVPNFIAVSLALRDIGHAAVGIRLDSGDLAYLSKETRRMFIKADEKYGSELAKCKIVASNDINERVLHSLNDQGHDIDVFGIGTNLVTCQAQPALGMVYKLVEIDGIPRIKLSQDMAKVTLPGAKEAFRLIGSEGVPILDLIIRVGEPRPEAGKRTLCRHPFDEKKRAFVTPAAVIPLLRLVWKGARAKLEEKLATDSHLSIGVAELAMTDAAPGSPSGRPSGAGEAHVPPLTAGLVPMPVGERRTPVVHSITGLSGGSGVDAGKTSSVADSDALAVSSSSAGGSGSGSALAEVLSPSAIPAGVDLRARFPSIEELRGFVKAQLALIREDHLRPLNPTPYKVSVSTELFHFCHDLWMKEVPIPELE